MESFYDQLAKANAGEVTDLTRWTTEHPVSASLVIAVSIIDALLLMVLIS